MFVGQISYLNDKGWDMTTGFDSLSLSLSRSCAHANIYSHNLCGAHVYHLFNQLLTCVVYSTYSQQTARYYVK